MKWDKIQVQINNISTSTERAILINMPSKSKYKGYSFWHTSKLTRRSGKNGYLLTISFTNDFKFNIKKYGKGQYNFNEIIDEKTITSEELKEAFGFINNTNLSDLLDD